MGKPCSCGLDIDLASHVQQLLFPKSSPVCNWCCIGTKNRMAQGLGGDFFDFITLPDDCQAVFIGDVTGHGVHASLVMALLYGFIHRSFHTICSPLELVRSANDFLHSFAARSRQYDHFFSATLFCGVIDPQTLQMRYVNAGHPPPLIRRQGRIGELAPTATPLGFFDSPELAMRTFQFARDDRLLLYTDGIVEAANERGEPFGADRLKEVLLRRDGDHLHFLEEVFASLEAFGAECPPRDDCTAIVIDLHAPGALLPGSTRAG